MGVEKGVGVYRSEYSIESGRLVVVQESESGVPHFPPNC